MELSKYVGKHVKVDLANGFFYEGFVTDAGNDFIELKDRNEHLVTISINTITFIREVGEWFGQIKRIKELKQNQNK